MFEASARAARSLSDSYLVAKGLTEPQANALIEAAKAALSATHSSMLLTLGAMVNVLAVVVLFMLGGSRLHSPYI